MTRSRPTATTTRPHRRGPLLRVGAMALLFFAAPHDAWAGSSWRGGWPRAAQDGGRRGGAFDADGPGSSYAPSECRWVQVAKEPLEPDASGRMVYRVTQQNSCTGKKRTFRTY